MKCHTGKGTHLSTSALAWAAASLLLYGLPGLADAASLSTRAIASVSSGGAPARDLQQDTTPLVGDVSAAASGTNQFGSPYDGSARAFVDASNFAKLRISGSATMTGTGQTSALSFIGIQETWTISSAGVSGQSGAIRVPILVDGFTDIANNATIEALTGVGDSAGWNVSFASSMTNPGPSTTLFSHSVDHVVSRNRDTQTCFTNGVGTGSCYGLFTFDIPFTFDEPFDVHYQFSSRADSISSSTHVGHATYELANSLYWGGFSSVMIGNTTVTDYEFTSDSGFDWRQSAIPVPEPHLFALLLVGLGLIGLRLHRQR